MDTFNIINSTNNINAINRKFESKKYIQYNAKDKKYTLL